MSSNAIEFTARSWPVAMKRVWSAYRSGRPFKIILGEPFSSILRKLLDEHDDLHSTAGAILIPLPVLKLLIIAAASVIALVALLVFLKFAIESGRAVKIRMKGEGLGIRGEVEIEVSGPPKR